MLLLKRAVGFVLLRAVTSLTCNFNINAECIVVISVGIHRVYDRYIWQTQPLPTTAGGELNLHRCQPENSLNPPTKIPQDSPFYIIIKLIWNCTMKFQSISAVVYQRMCTCKFQTFLRKFDYLHNTCLSCGYNLSKTSLLIPYYTIHTIQSEFILI